MWFHGTSFPGALAIMADGFLPSIGGAMHDAIKKHLNPTGDVCPVTYCAKSFHTAKYYPYANWHAGYTAVDGCGLGVVPAVSGGYPIRAVFICEASVERRLAGQPNQSAFLPFDLHITHVVFYAIDFRYEEPRSMQLRLTRQNECQRLLSIDVGVAYGRIVMWISGDDPAFDILPLAHEAVKNLMTAKLNLKPDSGFPQIVCRELPPGSLADEFPEYETRWDE